ncbi:transcriptional repressor AgaR [Thalassotalea sp. 1_MG-2023]|uniref:transcriptional repressor AgaR n=1 Tax=Thalassotalea sp. 1_MG-2023 TaxID=3062680 RepID=UPI0026E28CE6|nr:transcriptional repressor AgaR [Thalassotalea sp. 1_MG-2023]MDO6427374.1 transcriptional repressor AgaR [Thalassotalea sp. 1_MG-2023]
MMNTVERRHDIVQKTLKHGRVAVDDLATNYQVSEVTIRGDLNYLDKKSLVSRTRGGAVASKVISKELSINEKHCAQIDIKRKLAELASHQIKEGDAIILDSGSTMAELANCLHTFERLVVMTNGLNVAQNLLSASGVEVLMTGGVLRKTSLSFYGRQAEDSLERYHFDKAFLGVDGIDFNSGITTHFEYEAMMNRLMRKVAKEVITVADSSKFNRSGVHKICGLAEIDVLITDSGIPDAFAQMLERNGVNLIIHP